MAYIGRGLDKISNIEKLDAITFDGSQSYSLTKSSVAFTPNSANSLIISINGVCQFGNVTVSGTSVDFGVAMPSTDTNDFILHLGVGVVNTPADATVTNAKLAQDIISGETELTAEPASTDEFLVSDAGTLKRLDFSLITNTPNWKIGTSAAQSLAYNTSTIIEFDTSIIDSDSGVDTTNYRYTIPAGKGGTYIVHCSYRTGTGTDIAGFDIFVYVNGALYSAAADMGAYTVSFSYNTIQCTGMLVLSAGDYIEMYAKQAHVNASHDICYSGHARFWGYRLIGA